MPFPVAKQVQAEIGSGRRALLMDEGLEFPPSGVVVSPKLATPHGPIVADAVAREAWNVAVLNSRLFFSHDVPFLCEGAPGEGGRWCSIHQLRPLSSYAW